MTTFYVDAVSGSDLNDGLTPETAWRSPGFVSQQLFQPGDSILFRAGERFVNDPLTITSSGTAAAPITIGRYGEGANPLFDGTLDLLQATWTETAPGSHVWQTHLPLGGPDPRKFVIDGTLQIESGALGDLDQPGEWHYQTTGRVLSLYSNGDPSTAYSSLDIQYRQSMIELSGAQYVVVRDIDATMARYGIQLDGAQHVRIVDFNGYGNVLGGIGILNGSDHNVVVGGADHNNGVPGYEHHVTTKLGSGIFINNSSDNIVEGVRLFANFEDGLQFGGPAGGSGNIVRDCVVYGNLEDGFDIKSGDQSVLETLVFGNAESGLNHNASSTVTLFGNVVDSPNTNRGLSLDTGTAGRFDSIDNTYTDGRQTTAAIYAPSQASTFLGDVFFAESNQKVLAITAGSGTSITDSVIMLQSGSEALLASGTATNVTLLGNVFFTQGPLDLHYAQGTIAASDRNLYANDSSAKNWIRVGSVTYTQADLASGRYAAATQLDTHSQVAALSLLTDPSGRLVLTDGTRILAVVTDPHALDVPPDQRLVGGDADDTLAGGPGFDVLYGHDGADSLAGGDGDDKAYGDAGDDTVEGGAGADRLHGGAGDDSLLGGADDDRLYGQAGDDTLQGNAGADRLYGGDGDDSLQGGDGDDRLYGLAGDDTLQGDAGADLLRGGAGSDRLDGGDGDDSLDGGEGADVLAGAAGDDLLDGGAEADTMRGGAGDDTYIVADPGDRVLETEPGSGADSGGTDRVEASVSFTLTAFVENLVLGGVGDLHGNGNDLANDIAGNPGANSLKGRGGSDTLHGGAGVDTLDGGSGADLMYGGADDDIYMVDDPADQAVEADPGTGRDSGGTDTVNASASFAIGPFIETLRLTGAADIDGTGNDLSNRIAGNSGANVLAGGLGNDTLSGAAGADILSGDDGSDSLSGGSGDDTLFGGAGADRLNGGDGADLMYGGAGNDTYTVRDAADRAVEADPGTGLDSGGTDTVNASVSFTIEPFIETLKLAGAADIDGTGNDLSNRITGNSGANVLAGAGGNDTLSGAAGADVLSGADGNDSLTGGSGDDTLFGGGGADKLDGGDGADLMYGGAGNDIYTIRDGADRAVEADPGTGLDSGGADTVKASVSFTIEPFIETLKLTGTAPVAGTGNDAGNRIIGNSGANVLAGAGGHDTLTGGGGDDTFVLDAPNGTSADRITDFSVSQGDRIGVHGSDYGLAPGALDPDWFESGATATRSHAEFLYDDSARALLWDPDGSGAAAATTIATFAASVALSHADFVLL